MARPGEADLWGERDLRQLPKLTAGDVDELRAHTRVGHPGARAKAAIILALVGDGSAGAALTRVLADPDCLWNAVTNLPYLGDEAFLAHRELLIPWLLQRLDSEDEAVRACTADVLGRFRVEEAGPRLLRLAQEAVAPVLTGERHSWFPPRLLAAAAAARPGPEVAEEARRWLDLQPAPGSGRSGAAFMPDRAMAVLAERGAPGVYEWALGWCAGVVASGGSRDLADAVASRGAEGIALLERIARQSAHGTGAALEALAGPAPALADRLAREEWQKCPDRAVQVLAELHAGTAAEDVVRLLVHITDREQYLEETGVRALVRIGGYPAVAAANRLLDRFARRAQIHQAGRVRELRRQVVRAVPAAALTDHLVRLRLLPRDTAHEVLEALVGETEPLPPAALLAYAFHRIGRLASCYRESDGWPPPYRDLVTEFVAAADGTVRLDSADLAERPDGGLRLSLTRHGATTAWDIPDNGDQYHLETVREIARSLVPDGDDPRRFVEISPGFHVFADPGQLAKFLRRNGIADR